MPGASVTILEAMPSRVVRVRIERTAGEPPSADETARAAAK
jgi:hypothetical protein